ncbi:MAG TPA: hypothetical protein ENH55_11355 [Aurantimonas coralicida]|uniref:Uncharacterized protein n=2 Tax=root TaxID=1 RepID=A0A9C9NHH9_9HYPH|nr:hypothetical protein [Aurantimonas coralicida]HEU01806.1 hypothetical protein [Aurantimonas coralicida]
MAEIDVYKANDKPLSFASVPGDTLEEAEVRAVIEDMSETYLECPYRDVRYEPYTPRVLFESRGAPTYRRTVGQGIGVLLLDAGRVLAAWRNLGTHALAGGVVVEAAQADEVHNGIGPVWRVWIYRRCDHWLRQMDTYAVRSCGTVITGANVAQVRRRERFYRERVGEIDWSAVEAWPETPIDVTDARVREKRGPVIVNVNCLRWIDAVRGVSRILRPLPMSLVQAGDGHWLSFGTHEQPDDVLEAYYEHLEMAISPELEPPVPIADDDMDAIAAL